MSLMERIREIETEEREAAEAVRRAQAEAEAERKRLLWEQYEAELPGAILEQRKLLEALGQMGVIASVEEMIAPDKLHFPLTPAERIEERERVRLAISRVGSSKKIDKAAVQVALSSMYTQKWQGRVVEPMQREDGTLDPSARIRVDDRVIGKASRGHYSEQWVDVLYSPIRRLIIQGAEIFFDGYATPQRFDIQEITNGLAMAFVHPNYTKLPPGPDHHHPVPRYL